MQSTERATALYAVYTGPGGPISVRLEATNLTDALAEIEAHGQDWYDDGRTDLENVLDVTWEWRTGRAGMVREQAGRDRVRGDIEWVGGNALHYAEADRDYDVWEVPA